MDKNFEPKGSRKKHFPRKLLLLLIPVIIIVILVFVGRKFSWREIKADEVAVIINNITGKINTVDRAGAIIYFPFIQDLYILDKKEQEAPMTSANISAEYPEGNPVMLKTLDGGDVKIDLIVQYKLISRMADSVVQNTGTGEQFKEKWIWDYAKTICRYEFGELSINEFPDSDKREERIRASTVELNRLLNQHGIYVTSLNFIDYRYYREYAEKIHERRLANKEVEEQVHMGRAAEKNQEKVVTEETKKLDVTISRFRGELHKMNIDAEAEADRIRDDGLAYLIKSRLDADAEYDYLKKEAASILAVKTAEAAGILALKRALEGEGGRTLVKLEYAKRLRKASIIGTPVLKAEREIPQLRIEREREEAVREVAAMPPAMKEEKHSEEGKEHGGHGEEHGEEHGGGHGGGHGGH